MHHFFVRPLYKEFHLGTVELWSKFLNMPAMFKEHQQFFSHIQGISLWYGTTARSMLVTGYGQKFVDGNLSDRYTETHWTIYSGIGTTLFRRTAFIASTSKTVPAHDLEIPITVH